MVELSPKLEVTQRIEFSCSYLVFKSGEEKLNSCRYVFEATVESSRRYQEDGRIISFDDLKELMNKYSLNGKFICRRKDSNAKHFGTLINCFLSLHVPVHQLNCESEISAEKILEYLSLKLDEDISIKYNGIATLKQTRLRENSNSYVTWSSNR